MLKVRPTMNIYCSNYFRPITFNNTVKETKFFNFNHEISQLMNRDTDMINLMSTTPIIEDCLLCSVDNPCGFSNNAIENTIQTFYLSIMTSLQSIKTYFNFHTIITLIN